MSHRTFIIAEAGVNHNGSLDLAFQLIDAALDAKADAVKFQTFVPESLVSKHAPKAQYQQVHTDPQESQLEMIRSLALPLDNFIELNQYAQSKNIEFLTTAFDDDSIEFLKRLDLKRLKIPSGEITNLPYLRKVAAFQLPTILSTGMATLTEVEAAVDVLTGSGIKKQDLIILHCNTEYPTPTADVNLLAMNTMQRHFDVNVGYSDHTLGTDVAPIAVALGAVVIEKHFTLDKTMAGPDHQASLSPDELKILVERIRNVELMLGNGIKAPTQSERKNIDVARKSIVAVQDIKKGELYSENNICCKRPGSGISPMRWDEVLNKAAKRNFSADEMIEL